jgi:hypothetical protein
MKDWYDLKPQLFNKKPVQTGIKSVANRPGYDSPPARSSPLDVPPIKLDKPVTADEIIGAIKKSRSPN